MEKKETNKAENTKEASLWGKVGLTRFIGMPWREMPTEKEGQAPPQSCTTEGVTQEEVAVLPGLSVGLVEGH